MTSYSILQLKNYKSCNRWTLQSWPKTPDPPTAILAAGPSHTFPEGEDSVRSLSVTHHAEQLGPVVNRAGGNSVTGENVLGLEELGKMEEKFARKAGDWFPI